MDEKTSEDSSQIKTLKTIHLLSIPSRINRMILERFCPTSFTFGRWKMDNNTC